MDAHELLRFLLDGVSMEEIDVSGTLPHFKRTVTRRADFRASLQLQLIKKIQPQPAQKKSKKKKRKGPRPVAEQLRRKAALAAGETLSSDTSSSEGEEDLSSSEAESILSEDPTYRLPPRDPPPPRYTPFIDTIFGGKLASVIVCEECRGVSRIEEDFLDISLPIKGDDGKVRRVSDVPISKNFAESVQSDTLPVSSKRDRLRKFLGSSSSNLKAENERPRLAPRAPTNILNPSESEVSDSEGPGQDVRASQASSNASISSGGAGTSSSGKNAPFKEETEDEREARLQRRKSLDPSSLRSPSPLRGFLSSGSKDSDKSRSKDRSLLSRGASLRVGGADSSTRTAISDATSKGSNDASTTRKKGKHAHLLAKPTREQQDYIRQLFAEIPLPTPAMPNPLAHLRVAQPGGQSTQFAIPTPTAAETNGSPLAMADATETGLYQCLVQFTSVELLDGDNAFQCRRCWKLLNPELVAQVGRKRAAKAMQKKEEIENKQLAQIKGGLLRDDTPRASVSNGSDGQLASRGESAIAINRKLLAERERQLAAAGEATPSSSLSPPPESRLASNSVSPTPDIQITANSPPISPPGTSSGIADPLQAGFSRLSVTNTNESVVSGSAGAGGSSLGLPTSSMSDLGAEADAEDRSDMSDAEVGNGDQSTGAATESMANSVQSLPASGKAASGLQRVSTPRAGTHLPLPTLPPRSQRFVPRRAHKRYLISSLPSILVLHLKRFQQTHKSMFSSFGDLKKLDDKVTFPLYLDMAPFMAPPPLTPAEPSAVERVLAANSGVHSLKSGDESDANHSSGSSIKKARSSDSASSSSKSWFRRNAPTHEMRSNCVYRLYAVIVHKGSMGSGHYVAMTYTSQRKHEGTQVQAPSSSSSGTSVTKSDHEAARQWIYCSDDIVRPASVDEVFKSQAYLLMYERIDPSEKMPAKM